MADNVSSITKEWLRIAEMDLMSASFLKNMSPCPLEVICYHCQQSAEKFLKSFLVHNENELLKTHDLPTLNKLCQKIDNRFSEIESECINLTDFSITTRYPYDLELQEEDINSALE